MSAYNALVRRLRLLLDRGVLRRAEYVGKVRVMQVSLRAGTAIDGVEHMESYGFTSHPLPGAESLVANLGGNSGRAIVILVNDRRHRIVIEEGEVAIYHHDGDFVHLKNSGEIHVKAANKVFLEAPRVECSDDLHVAGNITTDGDVTAGAISLKTHRTSGVQTGSGTSGGPVP